MMQTGKMPVIKTIATGQLLIGGKWKDAQTRETMPTIDPTTDGAD